VTGGFVVVKRFDDPRADVLFISLTETKALQTQHGFSHTFLPHDLGHVFSGGGGMLLDVLGIDIGCLRDWRRQAHLQWQLHRVLPTKEVVHIHGGAGRDGGGWLCQAGHRSAPGGVTGPAVRLRHVESGGGMRCNVH
jgi:hypothetical protein